MSSTPTPLIFFHANGYPSGVYRQFFAALSARANVRIHAPPLLDSPPACAAHRRWPGLFDQALALVATTELSRKAVLVGHSMGGYLALAAAAKHRDAVRAVVLVDSPIPTGLRRSLLSLTQATGLIAHVGPAPVAARRRDRWPDQAAARQFFAQKAFVQRWAPGVLDDFIAHAVTDAADGGVTLRVPRNTERDIYAHLAHGTALRALRQLQRQRDTPVHFIAGESSVETRMAGFRQNARLFAPHFHTLPTGHLVPLEAPEACAALLLRLIGHG